MSAPPSAFAQAFRAHVIPRLKPRISAYAYRVHCGGLTFSEAVAGLIGEAHGATLLDRATFDQFADWLATQIIEAIARHERVAADIARCLAHARREDMAA